MEAHVHYQADLDVGDRLPPALPLNVVLLGSRMTSKCLFKELYLKRIPYLLELPQTEKEFVFSDRWMVQR